MAHNMLDSAFISDKDVSFTPKWNSITETVRDDEKDVDGFDCNICLDSATDPVVTFCGHLFCWPCISKWLNVKPTAAPDMDEKHPNCPVCKASLSHSSFVPLYGCGKSASESKSDGSKMDSSLPSRPPPSFTTSMNSPSNPGYQVHDIFLHSPSRGFHHQPHQPYLSPNLGGTAMNGIVTPTVGMFGEMVFARMFGTSDPSLFPQTPRSPGSNLRMRRHEMQLDRSLNRVSVFLFCCIILCLLLF